MQGEASEAETEEDESKRAIKKTRSSLSHASADERPVRKLRVLSPKVSLVSYFDESATL